MSRTLRLGLSLIALFFASVVGQLPAAAAKLQVELNPIPQGTAIPTLTGPAFKGRWGGDMVHRTELSVKKQDGTTISGTIFYYWKGRTSRHPITGELGLDASGKLKLVVTVGGESGTFVFTTVGPKTLRGFGKNDAPHEGPIKLSR